VPFDPLLLQLLHFICVTLPLPGPTAQPRCAHLSTQAEHAVTTVSAWLLSAHLLLLLLLQRL
jgi:hypothetical protein